MWFSNIISQYDTSITDNPSVATILGRLNKKPQYHEWLNTSTNLKNNINQQSTLSMLDSKKWNEYTDGTEKRGFKNSIYADYAIGGPTVEMFCESYNSTHGGDDVIPRPKDDNDIYYSNGYKIEKIDNSGIRKTLDNYTDNLKASTQTVESTDINSMQFKCTYWLSSPSGGKSDWVLNATILR